MRITPDEENIDEAAAEEVEDLEAPAAALDNVAGGAMGCIPPSCLSKDSGVVTLCNAPTCKDTKDPICDSGTHVVIVHEA